MASNLHPRDLGSCRRRRLVTEGAPKVASIRSCQRLTRKMHRTWSKYARSFYNHTQNAHVARQIEKQFAVVAVEHAQVSLLLTSHFG